MIASVIARKNAALAATHLLGAELDRRFLAHHRLFRRLVHIDLRSCLDTHRQRAAGAHRAFEPERF